jgi:hypothetical protein
MEGGIRMENSIAEHEQDYKEKAYLRYSFYELGSWVHNLAKRADHRDNEAKAAKDLEDARNYLAMMELKLKNKTAKVMARY